MIENDPLEDLRSVDPVARDGLPSASLARVRARVHQETLMTNPSNRPTRTRVWALSGTVIAIAAMALLAVGLPRTAVPSPSDPLGPVAATCVETYSLATLSHRSIAFDGTVTSIAGDDVTFTLNRAFRGVSGSSVTLTASGMTGATITSAGGPTLTVGGRFLVAGEDTFAWGCGFTQPYDEAVATQWAGALGA